LSTLGIITVVTNEKHNLEEFYQSLLDQTFADFTLYFVDNNSGDGSYDFFSNLNADGKLKVKLIKLDYNSGFSMGCNVAAKKAINDGCKYLFISNNDLVYDKNAISELMKLVKADNSIVCAGPLLMMHSKKAPGIIQEFGGKVNFRRGTMKKYYESAELNKVTLPEVTDTDFVGGGVCFIRADVFEKAGMFETAYFGYFDEIDLSYRLKVVNHYKMAVTSKAIFWHDHYWTKKQKSNYYFEYYLSERNKFLYFHKYRMYFSMMLMFAEDCIKFPWRLRWFISVCDFKLGMYYLKGMFHGLANKKGKPDFLLQN
jgi:GT2 family glycosyltransferase